MELKIKINFNLDLLTWIPKKVDYTNTLSFDEFRYQNKENYNDNDFQIWKKRWQERLLKNNNKPEKYEINEKC